VSKPAKYSVLLPTRNRSHVVHHAIRSVLGQTHGDLELVISDNSSNDDTMKLVRSIDDQRIKYVRTDRVLGMPDNFENALANSTGEWVTLLPDDCVISSRCLEIIEKALGACPSDLVVWEWWHYYPSTAEDPKRRTQYVRRPFGGTIRFQSSHDSLLRVFDMTHGKALPRPYQCCVKRSLVEALRSRIGRVFAAPAPDYTFLTGILALTPRYTYVDLPMMLSSAGDTSPHASPESFYRFLDELGEAKKGGWMPIKIPVIHPATILVESICRVRATMPELAPYELDLRNFLVDFKRQLVICEEQGFSVDFERRQFNEFMARLPLVVRFKVELEYARQRAGENARKHAKRIILRARLLERLAGVASDRLVVRGAQEGFDDIEGAMKHVERTFGPIPAVGV